ncbi:MAG: UTP--glucose-1-phosphate uridylyltransferase GalU [Nitrococcus mobilis]|nr:UTP--glucose-1-phosphate uridylyltransferase GalU [Nitrococcus mobilis]
MSKAIRKAVFPVAGLGTRFLPATKANPKEMLPVVDKPLVQYAVEEAIRAGIEVLVFITGRNKRSIPDHFDKAYELESELEAKGKAEQLNTVRNIIPSHVTPVYIRQTEALGLGHAVLCAEPVIGDEPFAVILADDLIDDAEGNGCLAQMVEQYAASGASILGVQRVPVEHTDRYGIVDAAACSARMSRVQGLIEKPQPQEAPSDLGVVGRYILNPRIFQKLRQTIPGSGGEIQLTDAIAALMEDEAVLAYEFRGTRYDCGDKLGYLQAQIEFGLKHAELGDAFREYLLNRTQ